MSTIYELIGWLLLFGIGVCTGVYWSACRYEHVIKRLRTDLAFQKCATLYEAGPRQSDDHGEQGGDTFAPNPCRTNAILAQPAGPSAGTISKEVTP